MFEHWSIKGESPVIWCG